MSHEQIRDADPAVPIAEEHGPLIRQIIKEFYESSSGPSLKLFSRLLHQAHDRGVPVTVQEQAVKLISRAIHAQLLYRLSLEQPNEDAPDTSAPMARSAQDIQMHAYEAIEMLRKANYEQVVKSSEPIERKPMTEDCACGICLEPFDPQAQKIVWCRARCGVNYHEDCWGTWAEAQSRAPQQTIETWFIVWALPHGPRCPLCRAVWIDGVID